MKKLLNFCSFLFVIALLNSCAGNDEVEDNVVDNPSAGILGTWLLTGLTVNGTYEDTPEDEGDTFLEFKQNGSLVLTSDGEVENGSYTLNGNKITITSYGESETYTITELTSSSMKLFGKGDVDENPGEDEVYIHLSKQ